MKDLNTLRMWSTSLLMGLGFILLVSMPMESLPLDEWLIVLVLTKCAALALFYAAGLIIRRAWR